MTGRKGIMPDWEAPENEDQVRDETDESELDEDPELVDLNQ